MIYTLLIICLYHYLFYRGRKTCIRQFQLHSLILIQQTPNIFLEECPGVPEVFGFAAEGQYGRTYDRCPVWRGA